MNNQELELKTQHLEKELMIEKQKSEIANLKSQVELERTRKLSKLEDSLLSPSMYEHYKNVASTLASSDMVPSAYRGKPANTLIAMEMGYKLGLSFTQALQNIAVINGTPSLWGDAIIALALNHKECEAVIEDPLFEGDKVIGYRCTVKRKGYEPHSKIFTVNDAKKAGLWDKKGPWTQYPERMLQLRARSFAIRDRFADALLGLPMTEEVEDYNDAIESTAKKVEEKQDSYTNQTDRLKSIVKKNEQNTVNERNIISTNENNESVTTKAQLIDEIENLMQEKGFDEERKQRAFNYYNIDSLNDLTKDQAKIFLIDMKKAT